MCIDFNGKFPLINSKFRKTNEWKFETPQQLAKAPGQRNIRGSPPPNWPVELYDSFLFGKLKPMARHWQKLLIDFRPAWKHFDQVYFLRQIIGSNNGGPEKLSQ